MKTIKEKLIKLLGGFTAQDVIKYTDAAKHGVREGALRYAESLNGMNADDWCKNMYLYLSKE